MCGPFFLSLLSPWWMKMRWVGNFRWSHISIAWNEICNSSCCKTKYVSIYCQWNRWIFSWKMDLRAHVKINRFFSNFLCTNIIFHLPFEKKERIIRSSWNRWTVYFVLILSRRKTHHSRYFPQGSLCLAKHNPVFFLLLVGASFLLHLFFMFSLIGKNCNFSLFRFEIFKIDIIIYTFSHDS